MVGWDRGPGWNLPGGGAFTPADLPSARLWLRADLGVTLTGPDVQGWANQISGVAAWGNAAAPVGDEPLFVAGAGPNSRPIVKFDPLNLEHLVGTIPPQGGLAGTPWSVWAIVSYVQTNNRTLLDVSDNPAATNRGILNFASGLTTMTGRIFDGTTTRSATGTFSGAGVFKAQMFLHQFAERELFENDVSLAPAPTNPEVTPSSTILQTDYSIGQLFGGLFLTDMELCELVVCQSLLNTDNRLALDTYSTDLYGAL